MKLLKLLGRWLRYRAGRILALFAALLAYLLLFTDHAPAGFERVIPAALLALIGVTVTCAVRSSRRTSAPPRRIEQTAWLVSPGALWLIAFSLIVIAVEAPAALYRYFDLRERRMCVEAALNARPANARMVAVICRPRP